MLLRKREKYIWVIFVHLPFALEQTSVYAIMIKPIVISRAPNVLAFV